MGFEWLTKEGRQFLKRGYLEDGISAEQRIRQIADEAGSRLGIEGWSDKFYEYMSKGWYSLSSPVWANYGLKRGMPISCFGSYSEDSVESMLFTGAEIGTMSKYGGGTSIYLGDIRARGSDISTGGKADGPVHYAKHYETVIDVFKQSETRRGSCAIYLPIDHSDIMELLSVGTEGHPIQKLQYGVNVPDWWMKEMIDGDRKKRSIWAKVIKTRKEIGFPYIFFTDNVNKNKPKIFDGETIYASNLCSEIMLPSNKDLSFVCCLSSINLLHYDDWKNTDAVEVLVQFLDTVISEFLEKSHGIKFMERAHEFAKLYRALGMGVLGWHSLLQSKMIPFESMEAKLLNVEIFKNLDIKSLKATKDLAKMFGGIQGDNNIRNATRLALPPTKSSSFISGAISKMIEPEETNLYVKELAKISTIHKNKFLEQLLIKKGKNFKYVWDDIMKYGGSVQHLDFLTDHEKNVFKTAMEISPLEVIQQAAARQKYIDQGQSLNLFIHPSISAKDINKLLITAWELGLKSLYYQKGENAAQSFSRKINECNSCEG